MADRSSPFDDVQELLDKLATQLESAARTWETDLDAPGRFDRSTSRSATNLDLADEGEAFVVTVDVPGYDGDDLEIRLSGDTLSIRGERERTAERDDDTYLRREREVTSFSRQVSLPEPVDADEVDATVNNGILTIRLPKVSVDEGSREIEIG